MVFRLLTYNILHGGGNRLDAIADVINHCAPDLVVLQEASDPGNVEKLAGRTGMTDWRSYRKQSLGFMSRKPVEAGPRGRLAQRQFPFHSRRLGYAHAIPAFDCVRRVFAPG